MGKDRGAGTLGERCERFYLEGAGFLLAFVGETFAARDEGVTGLGDYSLHLHVCQGALEVPSVAAESQSVLGAVYDLLDGQLVEKTKGFDSQMRRKTIDC